MTEYVDGYQFDFPNALNVYKFDQTDKMSPYYHGVTALKAVDMIAEFSDKYIFVEIKTFDDEFRKNYTEGEYANKNTAHLIDYLVMKYRDTHIYRYCENKLDKPIIYICLLNFATPYMIQIRKQMLQRLPVGYANAKRWKRLLLQKDALMVVDEATWNRNLTIWGTCQYVG